MRKKNQKRASRAHRGIAIGPILFVIAILAVLVSALASGSGGFNSGSSAEKAKVLASQIIQQANLIKGAVDRVRTNGCADEEISFENPVVSGYANPNAPLATMPWCHVFQPGGGGAFWPSPLDDIKDPAHASDLYYENVVFSATNGVTYVTSANKSGLILIKHWIPLSICLAINSALGITNNGSEPFTANIATDAPVAFGPKFQGTYQYRAVIDDGHFRTRLSGCFKSTRDAVSAITFTAGYHFFQVLVPR